MEWLLTDRVTAKTGTFTRFELTQAVAATLPFGTALREIEATVNRALASALVVQIGDHWSERRLVEAPDAPTAFAAYRDHGRVIITDSPDDLHAIVLADWHAARANGDALLLAGTRAEARLLNQYARRMLAANGELDLDREVTFAGRGYALSDHVVMCRNHAHQHLSTGESFAVDNGMRGTITDLSPEHMTVRVTSGEHVVLDDVYLENGWVEHGYAVTIHKAQGVTCDYVFVVGPAGLYREGAYVALSRAHFEAWLYATSVQADEIEGHRHGIALPTWKALVELGGMSGMLASGDQRDRAKFYEAVGITGLYKPHDDQVILTTSPRGRMVRVEGGT